MNLAKLFFVLPLVLSVQICAGATSMNENIKENVYKGDLVSFPGPWNFLSGKPGIILVSDKELDILANPDAKMDMSPFTKEPTSLRQVCEQAKAAGNHTLVFAFDQFFNQYRPGQAGPRKLTPDMDEYIQRIAAISKFASGYGLGLELSLLSPLEIGPAYVKATGESGQWMHYREGLRDPKSGAFSVQLWQQKKWANNKGITEPKDAGVRVFAFRETPIPGTCYRVVNPKEIVDVTSVAKVEHYPGLTTNNCERIRVYGKGKDSSGNLDHILVVQLYKTPEMDYFSDKAQPFLTNLIDKYADAGVVLNGLYSDEMHIQQDWNYFGHHDDGEFALRYVSDGFAHKFADKYGEQYLDFAKYLIYFTYGQHDSASDLSAKQGIMHVFGSSPEDIRRTALFRARYYHMLQDGVVNLFTSAKHYAEGRYGHKLEARAHATWAESPTIDYWYTGKETLGQNQYEYTSNFIWSNTVHQAAAACYDYFKWGDYLTGNGNDVAECGWLDRNYYGLAQACSTGVLNDVPYSYAACWGVPDAVNGRRSWLTSTYGDAGNTLWGMVQDMQHREVDVLMLYPIDLVATEERFGSWMTQYGYANTITQAKLLERGKVVNGAIELAGHRYTTLVTTFEPFPSRKLLDTMREMVESGGRVIWSGPPPVLTAEGDSALQTWCDIFGVNYAPDQEEGILVPGKQVEFEGALASVSPQIILTDFLVDHIYPVIPREGTSPAARVKQWVVGTSRPYSGGGTATFLGYRPRDDQSASLGYETRNWFEVLTALGAYPGSGKFAGVDDNTEYISRTSGYLACRFPNGAVAIAPHLTHVEEDWEGGFVRNQESDKAYIDKHPLSSDEIQLHDFKINGHNVDFDGSSAVCFRTDNSGELIAFAGINCSSISIDGKKTVFADSNVSQIVWAPISENRQVDGGAVMQIVVSGAGKVRIPAAQLPASTELVAQGATLGSRGEVIPCTREGGALVLDVTPAISGRWLYVVPQAKAE